MDSNTKPTSAIDATDTSVSSLASSFGKLELNHPTGDGPINRLPNEMMEQIVTKLASDGNALVRMRLVSTKWNSLVEHFCRNKKSLLVNCESFSSPNLKNYAPLIVRLKNVKFFRNMLQLFPNIEQLAVSFENLEDETQLYAFSVCINSLKSLKQLELNEEALTVVPHLSQTLSQLEHIGLFSLYRILNVAELGRFVCDLGPNCVGVFIGDGLELTYDQMFQYHNIKPNLFANLTHLRMCISRGSDQFVHLLSEHATHLEFLYLETYDDFLVLSPSVIRDLGKLVHLTELKIWQMDVDIAELDEARLRLTSLTSVLTCELYFRFGGYSNDGAKFTRILTAIFPKLINLHLYINQWLIVPSRLFLNEIKQNVHRFSNLRKHKIDFF